MVEVPEVWEVPDVLDVDVLDVDVLDVLVPEVWEVPDVLVPEVEVPDVLVPEVLVVTTVDAERTTPPANTNVKTHVPAVVPTLNVELKLPLEFNV